jgi:hypothetical protein
MTLIAPVYLPNLVLNDCFMPTCTCRHAKLSKTTCFSGQILNPKMSFFLGWREYYYHLYGGTLSLAHINPFFSFWKFSRLGLALFILFLPCFWACFSFLFF